MRLQVGQRTIASDLAQGLQNNEGTFFCQLGGQSYIAVAKAGHSITSLRPVGLPVVEASQALSGRKEWIIEKISDQEVTFADETQGRLGQRG